MDRIKESEEGESFFFASEGIAQGKGMSWIAGAIVGVFLLVAGCTHRNTAKELPAPDYLTGVESKQLTFFGDNSHPRFSFDNSKILFNSIRPPLHKGSQIYEIDLESHRERRVTYSDGDAFDATYISSNEFIYASTTDEIKESPFQHRAHNNDVPPSDLYMSDLFGTEILRLTKQPGFDGSPLLFPHSEKPFIIFSSRRGEIYGIYRLDLENLPVSLIAAEKGKEKKYPALSPDGGQVVWIERELKSLEQSLVVYNLKSKKTKVIPRQPGQYRDLFFASRPPERLFYSVQHESTGNYQIEVYDIAKDCTQVIFKGADDLFYPAVSDEALERMTFARSFQDKKQIYVARLPADLGPCLERPAQATLK